MDQAGVVRPDLGLGLEVGAARAVPALVEALVDVAVVVDALDDLLDLRHVLGVGGADEEVVGGVDAPDELAELRRVAVDQLLRRHPLALGRQRDRLAVLVGAGEKERVVAALAVVAGEHVGGDRRVRVAEMGLGVDVVDRRGDVEAHGRAELIQRLIAAIDGLEAAQLAVLEPCDRPGLEADRRSADPPDRLDPQPDQDHARRRLADLDPAADERREADRDVGRPLGQPLATPIAAAAERLELRAKLELGMEVALEHAVGDPLESLDELHGLRIVAGEELDVQLWCDGDHLLGQFELGAHRRSAPSIPGLIRAGEDEGDLLRPTVLGPRALPLPQPLGDPLVLAAVPVARRVDHALG